MAQDILFAFVQINWLIVQIDRNEKGINISDLWFSKTNDVDIGIISLNTIAF